MDATKTANVEAEKSLSGRTVEPTGTAEFSAPSVTRQKAASAPIKQRQKKRRKSKVDASTQLLIVQSTLARLQDMGIEVFARSHPAGIMILISGCEISKKDKFVVRAIKEAIKDR